MGDLHIFPLYHHGNFHTSLHVMRIITTLSTDEPSMFFMTSAIIDCGQPDVPPSAAGGASSIVSQFNTAWPKMTQEVPLDYYTLFIRDLDEHKGSHRHQYP